MLDARKGMAPGYWWAAPDGSAMYQCPQCLTIFMLRGPIEPNGKLLKLAHCSALECSWAGRLRLLDWTDTDN